MRFISKDAHNESSRYIEFISNRKRVKMLVDDIVYIESRDTEVWLHSISGECMSSRTNISSWADELGDGFVRIHRSFLVNTKCIKQITVSEVTLTVGTNLPISRTYRGSFKKLISS
ncbi:MAG: LytTR family DNA-binding domain-containing protein [Rikenellaceae bacterium]